MTDVLFLDDNGGGEIFGESESGLPSAVYISLFGDEDSAVHQLLDQSKPSITNLRRVKQASENQLSWMISDGVASSIDVSLALKSRTEIEFTVNVDGDETLRFSTNWGAETVDELRREPWGDVGTSLALPLDTSNLMNEITTAYNSVIDPVQGANLFRPVANIESTAYNETLDIPQGANLFRPVYNVESLGYNEMLDIPQGVSLFRPLFNNDAIAYNETLDIPQGANLFRPVANVESTAYNETLDIP